MKFTLSWLKDHLDTDASVDEIAETLTDLGLEVEEISNPGDRLKDFTLGYVKHAEKHPDADKLRVCTVDTDEGEMQIICGAPNAREGITVVVCKPGMYVPGLDITIGVGKIKNRRRARLDRPAPRAWRGGAERRCGAGNARTVRSPQGACGHSRALFRRNP